MMRNFFVLSLMILNIGCTKSSYESRLSSPDDKTTIIIHGTRTGFLDPWNVTTTVVAPGFEDGSLQFEIQAKELNGNISLDWKDNEHATLVFKQSDGEPRKFELISSGARRYLSEVGQ